MDSALVALLGAGIVGQWLTKVCGPTLEDVGHDLQQWVRSKRGKNVTAVVARAVELSAGKEVSEIPTRVLVPLLNGASNEDSPELQEKWAALLANAAMHPGDVPPSFPNIMSDLSPAEALLLDWVFLRDDPPREIWAVKTRPFLEEHSNLQAGYLAMMDHLIHLGLIRPAIDYDLQKELAKGRVVLPAAVGAPKYQDVRMTALGDAFVMACYPPGDADRQRHIFHI